MKLIRIKKKIIFSLILSFASYNGMAQTDVLSSALSFPDDMVNSPASFYDSLWKLYDGDGEIVSPESLYSPWSCFGIIENGLVEYENQNPGLSVGESSQGLSDGTKVALLRYLEEQKLLPEDEENRYKREYYHYVFPLGSSVSGHSTFSGVAERFNIGTGGPETTVMTEYGLMVVGFSKEPLGKVSINLEDGGDAPDIILKSSSGERIPSVWISLRVAPGTSSQIPPFFSKDLELPEGTKFVNFYGPRGLSLVSDLKLVTTVETNLVLPSCDSESYKTVQYFDLMGRRINPETLSNQKGILLKQEGEKIEKIINF